MRPCCEHSHLSIRCELKQCKGATSEGRIPPNAIDLCRTRASSDIVTIIKNPFMYFFRKKGTPSQGIYKIRGNIYEVSGRIYEITGHIYEISNIFFQLLPKKRRWGWHKKVITSNRNTIILIRFLFYVKNFRWFLPLVIQIGFFPQW